MRVPFSVCDAKMEKVITILNFKKKSYYSKNVGLCKQSVWLKKRKEIQKNKFLIDFGNITLKSFM